MADEVLNIWSLHRPAQVIVSVPVLHQLALASGTGEVPWLPVTTILWAPESALMQYLLAQTYVVKNRLKDTGIRASWTMAAVRSIFLVSVTQIVQLLPQSLRYTLYAHILADPCGSASLHACMLAGRRYSCSQLFGALRR